MPNDSYLKLVKIYNLYQELVDYELDILGTNVLELSRTLLSRMGEIFVAIKREFSVLYDGVVETLREESTTYTYGKQSLLRVTITTLKDIGFGMLFIRTKVTEESIEESYS